MNQLKMLRFKNRLNLDLKGYYLISSSLIDCLTVIIHSILVFTIW